MINGKAQGDSYYTRIFPLVALPQVTDGLPCQKEICFIPDIQPATWLTSRIGGSRSMVDSYIQVHLRSGTSSAIPNAYYDGSSWTDTQLKTISFINKKIVYINPYLSSTPYIESNSRTAWNYNRCTRVFKSGLLFWDWNNSNVRTYRGHAYAIVTVESVSSSLVDNVDTNSLFRFDPVAMLNSASSDVVQVSGGDVNTARCTSLGRNTVKKGSETWYRHSWLLRMNDYGKFCFFNCRYISPPCIVFDNSSYTNTRSRIYVHEIGNEYIVIE